MDYSGIISRAWRITWKYRVLWLFGLLAGGFNFGYLNYTFSGRENSSTLFVNRMATLSVTPDSDVVFAFIAALFIAVVVAVIIGVVVSAIAKAALIGMVRRIEDGEPPTVRTGFSDGFRNFMSLIGISLSIWVPVFIAGIVALALAIVPVIISSVGNSSSGPPPEFAILIIVGLLIGALIFTPVLVILGVLNTYADLFRVVKGYGVFTSISSGFRLIMEKKGPTAAVWLIIIGLGFVVGIAGSVIALVTLAPATLVGSKNLPAGILLSLPGIALLALGGAISQVFLSSIWTLAYLRLTGPGESGVDQEPTYAI